MFQENKARQIFRKNKHFLPPDTHTYKCMGKKCSFFGKIGVLCSLETLVLRFALLPSYRQSRQKKLRWNFVTQSNVLFNIKQKSLNGQKLIPQNLIYHRFVMANMLVTQSLAKILRLSTFRGNISLNFLVKFGEDLSQASIKCSKSTKEILEQGV